jgi:hypothetical protein
MDLNHVHRKELAALTGIATQLRAAREELAEANTAAENHNPRQLYLQHFDACQGTKDPNWHRLTEYRFALLLLEQCRAVRKMAGRPGVSPKVATFLWERDFRNAQGARRMLAYRLRGNP